MPLDDGGRCQASFDDGGVVSPGGVGFVSAVDVASLPAGSADFSVSGSIVSRAAVTSVVGAADAGCASSGEIVLFDVESFAEFSIVVDCSD